MERTNAKSRTCNGEPFATVQAGDKLAGEQLAEKDLGVVPLDAGWQQGKPPASQAL